MPRFLIDNIMTTNTFKKIAVLTAIIFIGGWLKLYAQSNFTSPTMIKNYLRLHLSTLDPIEGEYDVDWSCNYDTPMGHWEYPHDTFKIWIVKQNGTYTIYSNSDNNFRKSELLKINPIGDTNAYTLYYYTTPCRIILNNNNHFVATFNLNNQSANAFRGQSTAPSVKIAPRYDCIKIYPTATMYADNQSEQIQQEQVPKEWSGSGFALREGYIVTNYHVIDNAKTIAVRGIKGDFNISYKAVVVGSDKINDLALLKISDSSFTSLGSIPYSLSSTSSEVGEDIYVLGFPLTSTMGDEIKLTTGIISSKTGYQGDVSLYQISAPIQPGNSGGPLFDKSGNVIGVVSAKHAGAENVGYAVKASYLRNLIESCANPSIIPSTNSVSNQPLTGRVKAEKSFVYYIQCSSSDIIAKSEDKVIKRPMVGSNNLNDVANNTRTYISEIRLSTNYTAITLNLDNYVWCNISPDTYIQIGSQQFTIKGTNGIEFSPNKTYPPRDASGVVKNISCTLYFPPIPNKATSIDLIEPNSRWQFFNIKLLD